MTGKLIDSRHDSRSRRAIEVEKTFDRHHSRAEFVGEQLDFDESSVQQPAPAHTFFDTDIRELAHAKRKVNLLIKASTRIQADAKRRETVLNANEQATGLQQLADASLAPLRKSDIESTAKVELLEVDMQARGAYVT